MRKLLYTIGLFLISFPLMSQTVTGGAGTPFEYTEDLAGTGISKVYFLNTLSGATITYTSEKISVNFYRYQYSIDDKEAIPASDITSFTSGGVTTYTISNLIDSRGYLMEENAIPGSAVWVIDYSIHQPQLTSIYPIEDEDKCESLKLSILKTDELSFYTRNGGAKRNISRKYTIKYQDNVWDNEKKVFVNKSVSLPAREIGSEVLINAPLTDTYFTIRGDQIGEHFNIAKEVSTNSVYEAVAVKAYIDAYEVKRDATNEWYTEGKSSAPATFNFFGYGNENVSFFTWFIYNKRDLNNPVARYTDKDLKYTFEAAGDFLVKLEVADRSAICVAADSVSVSITESELEIPNFFSPDSSPGSNDEFRVAYKSLVKFKMTIVNRWGVKLYESTDPAKGWDGRYKGKLVNTGVYYYIIEALGSDGERYNEAGDINIIRSR